MGELAALVIEEVVGRKMEGAAALEVLVSKVQRMEA